MHKWISEYHGMELEPIADNNKRGNENGILFLTQYYLLKKLNNTFNLQDAITFKHIATKLRTVGGDGKTYNGLFDRGYLESINIEKDKLRTISHDNLTAIAAFSAMWHIGYERHIARHGLKYQFRYDNVYPENPRWSRIQHPRDWFFWLLCGGYKILSLPLFPIYLISEIVTCLRDRNRTSGKLLTFVRCESMYKKSILMRLTRFLCYAILRKMYGKRWLNSLMTIYFRHPEHPNKLLSKEIEL